MRFLILVISALIAACGGSGGSGDNKPGQPHQDFFAKGVYAGEVKDITGEDAYMIAIVGKDGSFLALNINYESVTNGKLSGSAPNAQGSAKGYTSAFYTFAENGLSTIDLSVSITQNSDKSLTGSTKYQGITNSNFTLEFDSEVYNTPPAKFASVAGTYHGYVNEVDVYLSIDSQGKVTGVDEVGCEYSASLVQEEAGKNIYLSNVSVSKCGNANGSYKSKALFFNQGDDTIFVVMGNNSQYAAGGFFSKILNQ